MFSAKITKFLFDIHHSILYYFVGGKAFPLLSYKQIMEMQGPSMDAGQKIFSMPFIVKKRAQLTDVVFIKFYKSIISNTVKNIQELISSHLYYANACILNRTTPKKRAMKKICLMK